jgi:hypothetical protein
VCLDLYVKCQETRSRVILFSAGFLAEVMTITPPPARSRSLRLSALNLVTSPVGPPLSVKEGIVETPEADVENQSSAMQRTRLS